MAFAFNGINVFNLLSTQSSDYADSVLTQLCYADCLQVINYLLNSPK